MVLFVFFVLQVGLELLSLRGRGEPGMRSDQILLLCASRGFTPTQLLSERCLCFPPLGQERNLHRHL